MITNRPPSAFPARQFLDKMVGNQQRNLQLRNRFKNYGEFALRGLNHLFCQTFLGIPIVVDYIELYISKNKVL